MTSCTTPAPLFAIPLDMDDIFAVDLGSVVDLVDHSAPFQPRSPDQPRHPGTGTAPADPPDPTAPWQVERLAQATTAVHSRSGPARAGRSATDEDLQSLAADHRAAANRGFVQAEGIRTPGPAGPVPSSTSAGCGVELRRPWSRRILGLCRRRAFGPPGSPVTRSRRARARRRAPGGLAGQEAPWAVRCPGMLAVCLPG
jgi:hypothetical protein